jgi:hypothetical protein
MSRSQGHKLFAIDRNLSCTNAVYRASLGRRNTLHADLESLLHQAGEEAVGLDPDADEMEMLVRSDLGHH